MLIQDRIRTIMKSGNHTASEFADRIGVKRSNLSHVLSGRNKPSLDFLVKIIQAYPNVDASWLVTGEVRKTSSAAMDVSNTTSSSTETSSTVNKGDSKEIEKILVFYKDGTFDKYTPNQQ